LIEALGKELYEIFEVSKQVIFEDETPLKNEFLTGTTPTKQMIDSDVNARNVYDDEYLAERIE
jgi:hypothetical protein